MESRHFKKILKIAADSQIRLNVIETANVKNDKVKWVIHTDSRGYLAPRSLPQVTHFRDLLAVYAQHHEQHRQVTCLPEELCEVTHKFGKLSCCLSTAKDLISKKNSLSLVSMVQRPPVEVTRCYSYTLTYIQRQYEVRYAVRGPDGSFRSIGKDHVYPLILDIVKTVVSALEQKSLKRVVHGTYYFALDTSHTVWLLNVTNCKLLDLGLCRTHLIRSVEDLVVLETSLPKKTPRFSRKSLKATRLADPYAELKDKRESRYVFRQGRVRNNTSFSPLRIPSPVVGKPKEDKTRFPLTRRPLAFRKTQTFCTKSPESPTPEFSRRACRSDLVPRPKCSSASPVAPVNPDFAELMLKEYCKAKGWSVKKFLTENHIAGHTQFLQYLRREQEEKSLQSSVYSKAPEPLEQSPLNKRMQPDSSRWSRMLMHSLSARQQVLAKKYPKPLS